MKTTSIKNICIIKIKIQYIKIHKNHDYWKFIYFSHVFSNSEMKK